MWIFPYHLSVTISVMTLYLSLSLSLSLLHVIQRLRSLSCKVSLYLSPSLHPPLRHVSLCISIFSSRCVCACLLCGSVCLIVRKRERVHKFKGTPGINVSSLCLCLSLSLIFCLSLVFFLWNQSRPLNIVSSEHWESICARIKRSHLCMWAYVISFVSVIWLEIRWNQMKMCAIYFWNTSNLLIKHSLFCGQAVFFFLCDLF